MTKYPQNYPKILKRCSWSSTDGRTAGPLKHAIEYQQRGDSLLLSNAIWAFGGEALGEEVCNEILKTWTLVYSEAGNGWEWRVQDQLEFLKLTMDRRKYEKCKEVLAKVKGFYSRLS